MKLVDQNYLNTLNLQALKEEDGMLLAYGMLKDGKEKTLLLYSSLLVKRYLLYYFKKVKTRVSFLQNKSLYALLFFCMTIQIFGAGYTILDYSNPNKFMKRVRANKNKYDKVFLDQFKNDIEIYIYKLDFQIIAQVGGASHVATVVGPISHPKEFLDKLLEAKNRIRFIEEN